MPERVAGEEALVDHRRVGVTDDRVGDEPALPARAARRGRRRRCPRRSGGSRRPSRRARRASSGASAGRRRRGASRPAPARSGACRSARPGARTGLRRSRSGVRRQIVPSTVGKRRSDGCQVPSGQKTSGPTRPARGCSSAKRTSVAIAPRPGRRRDSRRGRSRRSSPRCRALTFAANGRGRGFSSTRAPSGTSPTLPGRFAITTSSSTCGASAGQRLARARARARARRRPRRRSSRAPPGRPRACARRSRAS